MDCTPGVLVSTSTAILPLVSAETWYVAPLTDPGLPDDSFGPYRGYFGPATLARLTPLRIAAGPEGSLYIVEPEGLVRVSPEGVLVPMTGRNGEPGGDGGPSVAAQLGSSHGDGVDPAGNVAGGRNIWKVTPQGETSIAAGAGRLGFPPRVLADIEAFDVAVDSAGNLFIAERERHRVRKILPDGNIVLIAGKPNTAPLPEPVLPVAVTIGGMSAEVVYAGGAPDFIAGAMQVNARIPANARFVAPRLMELIITVGDTSGRPEYIAVSEE